MDKNLFIKNIKDQFADSEAVTLNFDSDFKDNEEFDSLTGMSIIVMLKDEYGIDIPVKEFKEIKKISALYEYVKNNK